MTFQNHKHLKARPKVHQRHTRQNTPIEHVTKTHIDKPKIDILNAPDIPNITQDDEITNTPATLPHQRSP